MALFIVFIIALVIGYMLIWSPFVSRLSKDVSNALK
jgi:type II secretory pathway component PulM